MFYIYTIFNLVNGKIYIGQTQNLNRWKEHLYIAGKPAYAKHKLIHKAIAKYGKDNFTFTIIQYLESKEESLDCEKYWIDFYQSNICKYPNGLGYNLTDGGESAAGFKWTQASKNKLSLMLRLTGKNNSAILTRDQVIDIKQLLDCNMFVKDIAIKYGVSPRAIRDIRNGKRWSYLFNDDFDNVKHGNLGRSATGKAKINSSQAKEIKNLLKINLPVTQIAKQFKISNKIVYDIKQGKSWKHVT